MKNAILLHGTGGSDKDYFWFADTKSYLEEHGYKVWWPLLPNTEEPNITYTLQFVQKNAPKMNEETVLIGHSSGCPLILSLLQRTKTPIKQAILAAGYYAHINDLADLMIEDYNWRAIKNAAKEIILINSDNDPWGCDNKQARPVAEALGAKFILAEGQGHMGSLTFSQPYKEFPLIKELLNV